MKNRKFRLPGSVLLLLLSTVGYGFPQSAAQGILEDIDRQGTFEEEDFSCQFTIVSDKPGEQTNIQQVRFFRRDRDDKFVILILKPSVQKGQGYLRIGENVWYYDPESRKFAHTSFRDNFQDTEAKHSDFRSTTLASDYRITEQSSGRLGSFDVHVLDLEALHEEVTYPRLRLWVDRESHLLLKEENYGLSGRLMRSAYYPSYIRIGEKYIASKMLFVNELREGEKTQITIKDPSLAGVPDAVFTKSYLERVNR